jgi:hypothetical protein
VLDVVGVDQIDGQAARFEDFEDGDPIDAGGFHGDGIHAAGEQPIGQGVQVGREGGEATHRLAGTVGGHGGPDFAGADVETGGVGVDTGQCV